MLLPIVASLSTVKSYRCNVLIFAVPFTVKSSVVISPVFVISPVLSIPFVVVVPATDKLVPTLTSFATVRSRSTFTS